MRHLQIPEFTSFFSEEAKKLIEWSALEKNRVKSRQIYEAACKVEYYYRKDKTGFADPNDNVWSGGCITKATPLWIIQATAKYNDGLIKRKEVKA